MFWLVSILLAAAASAFILAPLMFGRSRTYADQRAEINLSLYRERVDELKAAGDWQEDTAFELEAKKALLADIADTPEQSFHLAGDRRISIATALLVPLFALMVYADFGLGRGALPDVRLASAMAESDPSDPAAYRYFVQQIEERLEQKPDDPDTLFLLARGYANLGDFARAVPVLEKLLEVFPEDPNLLSQYAEMLYVLEDRKFTARVKAAVDNVLQVNPEDVTMLELSGIAAATEGDIPSALVWLNRALQTGVTGRRADLLRTAISELHKQAGPSATPNAGPEVSAPEQVSARVLNVNVSIADSVNLPSSAVVFVYARAATGSPAPLAVQRIRLDQLPASIRLDESMAMMPGMGLANFDQVVVIARASASGEVAPSPGDYEARSDTLDLNVAQTVLELKITEPL